MKKESMKKNLERESFVGRFWKQYILKNLDEHAHMPPENKGEHPATLTLRSYKRKWRVRERG